VTGPRKTLADLAAEQGIEPVRGLDAFAAAPEHRLTDAEWDAWQAAIHGCRQAGGDTYSEGSSYARLQAYADGAGHVPPPADVRALLDAYNAANAMVGVGKRAADNHRRRFAAIAALADTDEPVDPEALRRALATGTRTEHAASHPSTAQLRARVAELEARLGEGLG
jgi:hypothetical protein